MASTMWLNLHSEKQIPNKELVLCMPGVLGYISVLYTRFAPNRPERHYEDRSPTVLRVKLVPWLMDYAPRVLAVTRHGTHWAINISQTPSWYLEEKKASTVVACGLGPGGSGPSAVYTSQHEIYCDTNNGIEHTGINFNPRLPGKPQQKGTRKIKNIHVRNIESLFKEAFVFIYHLFAYAVLVRGMKT